MFNYLIFTFFEGNLEKIKNKQQNLDKTPKY